MKTEDGAGVPYPFYSLCATCRFGRVETLTGFSNALALLLASGNIIWEAVERMWDPTEIKTEELLIVSILGFLVNMGKCNVVIPNTGFQITVTCISGYLRIRPRTYARPRS